MSIVRAEGTKIQINLDGLEGNIFCLLGLSQTLSRKTGLPDPVKNYDSMTYTEIVQAIDKTFGELVTFVTDQADFFS